MASGTEDLKVGTLFSFHQLIVLVTGGSSGIGEMIAEAFVQNGAHVIIASRKQKELDSTTMRLNKLGPGRCEYIVADLKDKAGANALVSDVKSRVSRLNVLVNCAGASWGGPFDDFPEMGWDKLMALNVKSIFYLSAGLRPLLQKNATDVFPSRIINVASIAGIRTTDVTSGADGGLAAPGNGTFSYGPSKAAVIHLTKQMASKFAPLHINVNVVCPGVFPSRMTAYGIQVALPTLLARQPTGRIGRPSDIAGLVLFLSSLGSAHMTGSTFEIDGGSNSSGWKTKVSAPLVEQARNNSKL
ncbi:hypothetical protein M409DRAFT_22403 [Zasmidium cellare ATCC 36951]|uniref:Uncharacterized protein n=1 Tax=Zasmidium cellare ATCC 36951 TaxID=1080233 RepID=A0A6A6CKM7_ZASCE|nr:uncharacterized protein M409DRAFT_22403 [Zasmidium cellare ATCC 36951]KAF2167601.1 hypothetical protein M409DRAFT_22403 [Zasmidium cellare ATCC 36951]